MFAPRSGRFLAIALLPVALALTAFGLRFGPPVTLLILAFGFAIVWGFFAWFFRDPTRSPGSGVVSAADGRVLEVAEEGATVRIAVFMNVTDVHVNRFPVDGRVESIEVRGKGYRPAYSPDAHHNQRCHYQLTSAIGPVEVIQMTGIVARRLVPLVRPGDHRTKGERLGMIVLGSRVDVRLPTARVEIRVRPGDRVFAGTTTIAVERP
ncbi:MAG: phosphatidylserine decarboxylase [Thermoplasmata archaeon]|nr:phosphatidylserine decarboxylase [Thermoplasmata archaeon]